MAGRGHVCLPVAWRLVGHRRASAAVLVPGRLSLPVPCRSPSPPPTSALQVPPPLDGVVTPPDVGCYADVLSMLLRLRCAGAVLAGCWSRLNAATHALPALELGGGAAARAAGREERRAVGPAPPRRQAAGAGGGGGGAGGRGPAASGGLHPLWQKRLALARLWLQVRRLCRRTRPLSGAASLVQEDNVFVAGMVFVAAKQATKGVRISLLEELRKRKATRNRFICTRPATRNCLSSLGRSYHFR